MKYINQARIFGRTFREEEGGEGGSGSEPTAKELELQSQLADANKSIDALKTKSDELLGETKKAKAAKRDAEDAERKKNEESGNFELLYKASEDARIKSDDRVNQLEGDISNIKLSDVAGTLALSLNPLDNAAKDLRSKIVKRLKNTEDGVKVLDKNGNLTVSTMDQLAEEMKASGEISYMLKGNQSSGGGATGGEQGGGAAKTMTRADFDGLNPIAASKFMKAGGTLIQ